MFLRHMVCAAFSLILSGAAFAATPLSFIERWESYEAGAIPSSPWYVDPLMPDGGLTVIQGAIYNFTYGGSKGLLVNYAGFNGKDAGIQARLVPNGQEVKATDANKLILQYMAKALNAQRSEWYIELSYGDVHVPRLADIGMNPLPEPIPVLAYCKPYFDPSIPHKSTWVFDGQMWRSHGAMDWDEGWGTWTLEVHGDNLRVLCTCQNNPAILERVYKGNFDRVSIYTLDGVYQSYTVLDEIKITGGDIVHTMGVSPGGTFVSVGPQGGTFSPSCQTYTLTNISSTPLNWTATTTSEWLTITPESGTLAGGGNIDVQVCINNQANTLPLAMYPGVVKFNDLTHGLIQERQVELYVGQIDSFTEQFAENMDIEHVSVMLSPDETPHGYHACKVAANQFPTPPAGGNAIALSGNNSVKVTLGQGAQVHLYGSAYTEFYVGANGYITFGEGDTLATGTAVDHFKKRRISGLFADLAPQAGQVSYKQLMDRVAVTYQDVVKAGTTDANSFQIEMFYDGRIRLTWLDLATTSGLVGLSQGAGVPTNFHSSDFTAYPACPDPGYPADFDGDGDVDMEDFGHLQVCLTGHVDMVLDSLCADADLNLNGTVGQDDLVDFYACFNGPNVIPPSGCKGFGSNP